MVDEAREGREPRGAPGDPAVEADRQHLRPVEARGVALRVERVERVAQVRVELVAAVEALRRREPHVVRVERVGDDEVRHAPARAVHLGPVRQVVRVAVRVVDEAAVLDDQPPSGRAVAARVPPLWRPAGEPHDRVDRALEVLALERLVGVLVAHPAPAVARDLVPVAQERVDDGRMPQHRHPDAEDRERNAALAEQPQESPDAGPRAVLVERLHAHVAHPERLGADDLRQERLRRLVAVQHRVLAALLVVEDELDGDAGAAGPACVRRVLAVAGEVARVGGIERRDRHRRDRAAGQRREDTARRNARKPGRGIDSCYSLAVRAARYAIVISRTRPPTRSRCPRSDA